jgi:adenylate cyclase
MAVGKGAENSIAIPFPKILPCHPPTPTIYNHMLSKLRQRLSQWLPVPIAATGVASLVIALSSTGLFQYLELKSLDQFFRWRPLEPKDTRVVVVTIGEADISNLGHWPISDEKLARALVNLNQQKPKIIALDLYRNIPVEPGHKELERVYRILPNLIVVEKGIGDRISAPPIIANSDRSALADLVIDPDGTVRRSLLTLVSKGTLKMSLGTKAALDYLTKEGIDLESKDDSTGEYRLNKATFLPLHKSSGGYANIDNGGYQIFMNYRGDLDRFQTISISDVIANKISPKLLENKIVFIGSTGESLNDYFPTPYGSTMQRTPGVIIHANAASQILSAALDGRILLDSWSDRSEWAWIFAWSSMGSIVGIVFVKRGIYHKGFISRRAAFIISLIALGTGLFGGSYGLFLMGYWVPVISPLIALMGSLLGINFFHNRELKQLAFTDGLTKVANRRYLDRYLEQVWLDNSRTERSLAIILCDVDYFKLYNDRYGHQMGDECLQKVAKAITLAVRNKDLVARYGGEEFIVVLPETEAEMAMQIAQRMLDRIEEANVPHSRSQISDRVSLSCGVATLTIAPNSSPANLIAMADKALYQAKNLGRNRAIVAGEDRSE